MKNLVKYLGIAFILSIFVWSCSEDNAVDTKTTTIDEAVENSTEALSMAVNEVKTTDGYEVVMFEESTQKSAEVEDEEPLVDIEITLADISGVYEYKPVVVEKGFKPRVRFFERIGEHEQMLAKLPAERMFRHHRLHEPPAENEQLPENNFEIHVADYYFSLSESEGMISNFTSAFKLDGENAGALSVQKTATRETGLSFTSEFEFGDGYVASVRNSDGDELETTHTFMHGDDVLFEEKIVRKKMQMGMKHRFADKEYTMTLGSITIKRTGSIETMEIFVDGVKQENAVVEVVDKDEEDPQASVCRKRDIKITLDDGTELLLSELTGNVLPEVGEMFAAMRRAHFSTHVIGWIAKDVKKSKMDEVE